MNILPNIGSVNYQYRAVVKNWLDGDTVDVMIDLGFSLFREERVRLYGLNAPEVHTTNAEEKVRGLTALDYATKTAPPGTAITLQTYKAGDDAGDKYGRFLGTVRLLDGSSVNTLMLASGNAKPWDGTGKKPL